MSATIQDVLALHEQYFGIKATRVDAIAGAGSNRRYVRLHRKGETSIGVISLDPLENAAFFGMTAALLEADVRVPDILDVSKQCYLLSDLGSHSVLQEAISLKDNPQAQLELYKRVLDDLVKMQALPIENLPVQHFLGRPLFDRRAILWDLNYFKYNFLKVVGISFDEDALQNDFESLAAWIDSVGQHHFMYRDFQGRNIILNKEGELGYIDYQGARLGHPAYDAASLLWQAKAQLNMEQRTTLLEYHKSTLQAAGVAVPKYELIAPAIILIRLLQVLGAYGLRGLVEGKSHFRTSIAHGLRNIKHWIETFHLPQVELSRVLRALSQDDFISQFEIEHSEKLTVHITSFSYKRGYPQDRTGHGGGFVYDCRFIHNPGRYEPYKRLTGKDQSVKDFLEAKSQMPEFIKEMFAQVDAAVNNYVERGHAHLSVSFGCTGGQHRSVYSAEALTARLRARGDVKVILHHRESEHWPRELI